MGGEVGFCVGWLVGGGLAACESALGASACGGLVAGGAVCAGGGLGSCVVGGGLVASGVAVTSGVVVGPSVGFSVGCGSSGVDTNTGSFGSGGDGVTLGTLALKSGSSGGWLMLCVESLHAVSTITNTSSSGISIFLYMFISS